MFKNPYIYRLSVMHRQLDEAIRSESRLAGANAMRILRLKKLKLAVKDRLATLMRQPLRAH